MSFERYHRTVGELKTEALLITNFCFSGVRDKDSRSAVAIRLTTDSP
jgi:hypothetical protein